ncbi:hypothetical protein [Priestia endophytica]|uniref:hypothetical protein n=1 Tax=Priestia endophytica TaxID=135735 RepID=UPI00124F0EE7|nr:hypothetical protein [Priestia endophytica]KAB2488046.1 hypothetical protein F8155_25540 [Priestia endophytica]MCM3541136.1 hypothetical protein [Priestia endophytica]
MSCSKGAKRCTCDILHNTTPGRSVALGFDGVPISTTTANSCKNNPCATFVNSTTGVTIADCRKIKFVAFSP